MKLVRIKAIARKEFIQIWRDPLSLVMAFLMPVILLFIYGYAISFDVDSIATIVHDNDKSSFSRELVAQFRESGRFDVIAYPETQDDVDVYFDKGIARVAVIIPYDFSKNIEKHQYTSVQVIIDGSDSNTATIAQGYVNALSLQFAQRLSGAGFVPLIDTRSRVWYNQELKSRNYIVPGIIAVIMAVIVSLLTSLTIAREWDRGTMEQLISTPVKPSELLAGKLIPYFIIGLTDTILTILMGTLVFGVPLKGSVILLLILSAIFLFGGLSQGILISILGKTQPLATQIAMLSSFLPTFLLSGLIFPIANMPEVLRVFTYVIPARYYVTILKGIFLKGSGFGILLTEAVLLMLFAIVVYAVANRKFHKRIE